MSVFVFGQDYTDLDDFPDFYFFDLKIIEVP